MRGSASVAMAASGTWSINDNRPANVSHGANVVVAQTSAGNVLHLYTTVGDLTITTLRFDQAVDVHAVVVNWTEVAANQ